MKAAVPSDLRIVAITPEHRADALELVFAHLKPRERLSQVETLRTAMLTDKDMARGLFGAYRGDRLVAAVFAQVEPGRTAVVWPPHAVADEPADTVPRVLAAVTDWLQQRGTRIAQALVEADQTPVEAALRAAGFNHLADLLYLVCTKHKLATRQPECSLEFETYSAANHRRLADVIEATYEGSLDCPPADGLRHIDDVLEGYRATGRFDPGRWIIVRSEGRDVGCLILADHSDHGNWELVYMGVVASARGRGWGMQIARHAQWLTRRAAAERLVLAVDAANEPAIAMYVTVGFEAWDRRGVYLKVLPSLR